MGGTFKGVNLYDLFLSTVNTDDVTSVTFFGDGRKPEAGTPRKPKEFRDEHYEQRRRLARARATLLQRHIGNRAMPRLSTRRCWWPQRQRSTRGPPRWRQCRRLSAPTPRRASAENLRSQG